MALCIAMRIFIVLCFLISDETIKAAVDPGKLNPGDLLSFSRGLYEHWAVFAGDLQMVHVTGNKSIAAERYLMSLGPDEDPTEDGFEEFMAELMNNSTSGKESSLVVIKKETFEIASVSGIGNAQYDNRHLANFTFSPFPPDEILNRLNKFINKSYPYSLLTQNCEHFATFARYGIAISDQGEKVLQKTEQISRIITATKKLEDLMNKPASSMSPALLIVQLKKSQRGGMEMDTRMVLHCPSPGSQTGSRSFTKWNQLSF
ncbi:uncharacterized protein LOC120536313 [Polypterus senegalus]|uniref:uncharacterized protein LOC120536313 n=1 Tax=Polypterus senegalus TaxID=55291 RepID=UPI00196255C7|nr:uncharacterized protein LOC120536313 [Polypterus senegalus]